MKKIILLSLAVLLVVISVYFLLYNKNQRIKECLKEFSNEYCQRKFLQEGINYYSEENYNDALVSFKLAAKTFNNDKVSGFIVWRNIANTYLELKQYDKAMTIFDDLLTIGHEDRKLVYLDYIRLYNIQKKYEAALKKAEDAFKEFGDVIYLYKQASILEDMQRYKEEIVIYNKLLELDLDNESSIQFKIEKLKKVHNL